MWYEVLGSLGISSQSDSSSNLFVLETVTVRVDEEALSIDATRLAPKVFSDLEVSMDVVTAYIFTAV